MGEVVTLDMPRIIRSDCGEYVSYPVYKREVTSEERDTMGLHDGYSVWDSEATVEIGEIICFSEHEPIENHDWPAFLFYTGEL